MLILAKSNFVSMQKINKTELIISRDKTKSIFYKHLEHYPYMLSYKKTIDSDIKKGNVLQRI